MPTFPDLRTYDRSSTEDPAVTLTLPIRGHEYTWRSGDLSVWAMLQLQRLNEHLVKIARQVAAGENVDPNERVLTSSDHLRLQRELIGDGNLARMDADGIRWADATRVASTLLAWYLRGEDAAMAAWSKGETAKPAAKRAAKPRATARKAAPNSTS